MSKADNVEVEVELDEWKIVAETLVTSSKENSFQNNIQNHTSNQDSASETSPSRKERGADESFEAKDGLISAERLGVFRVKKSIEGYLCWSSKGPTAGDEDTTELSDILPESTKSEDKSENVKTVEGMFSFFSSGNEILWFR